MSPTTTVVHLVRHGEVDNPRKVLYGRLPGYHLSPRGHLMAEQVAAALAGRDITYLAASPLERAQETAAPLAAVLGLRVVSDPRLIEAANHFEGMRFGVGDGALRHPRHWPYLLNPLRPSWGEPYAELALRMLDAAADARDAARGHEAVLVSHQLPVWVARCFAEGRHLWHDPRRRECALASVTSLTYVDDEVEIVGYAEPAAAVTASTAGPAGA